jgi:hypothetical protein
LNVVALFILLRKTLFAYAVRRVIIFLQKLWFIVDFVY